MAGGRPATLREILDGVRRACPPEKRAQDYAGGYVVGAIYRPLSFVVSALVIRLGITANQVTYLRYVAIVAECISFASGTHAGMVSGSLCHLCHFLLDYVDGNIARYHGRPTRFGALLDGMADRLGYTLPPLTIGIGLYRRPDRLMESLAVPVPSWVPLAMGIVASVGTVLLTKWNPNRFWEFLRLIRGKSKPASELQTEREQQSRIGDDSGRQRMRIFQALETSFSNAAFVLESAVVVLALFDATALFLGFRFFYYVVSRLWVVTERVIDR